MELHTNLEKKLPLWFLRKVDQTSVVVYPNRPRCGKILVSTRGQRESWGTTRRPFVAFEPRCLWETSHCGLKQMRDGEAGAVGARGTPVGGAPQRYLRARPLREQTGGRAGDTMKVSFIRCRFTLFLPITCHARLQWGVSDVPRLQHVRNELALCARPGAPPSDTPAGEERESRILTSANARGRMSALAPAPASPSASGQSQARPSHRLGGLCKWPSSPAWAPHSWSFHICL